MFLLSSIFFLYIRFRLWLTVSAFITVYGGGFIMRLSVLSDSEYSALVTYLPRCTPRDDLAIRLMLQCGLRAGEVVSLNVDSVFRGDTPAPALYLAKSSTKTRSARFVDMPGPVRNAVSLQIAWLRTFNDPLAPTIPLLQSKFTHRRLTVRDVCNITHGVSSAAIGRRVNPHLLRHTYASILIRFTNVRVVQQLLGHSSLMSTQVYLHPSSIDCSSAVESAFGGAS